MRNNNFDILHLLCAILVIVSHSYALVGLKESEPLLRLTGDIVASDIGLCGFFTISGYFILNSLVTSKNIFSYIGKRCLRIFPALAVCLVVVVAACSLFYTGDGSYWGQRETYSFIWKNLELYDCQWTIPGVFESNPYTAGVDGSLWTLCYQFTLYLLIIPLFFLRKYRPAIVGVTMAAIVVILTKNVLMAEKFAHTTFWNMPVNLMMPFAQCFVVGMILQGRKWILTDKARWIAIGVSAAVAIVLIIVHSYAHVAIAIKPLVILCVSVVFIMVGEMYWQKVSDVFKRVGDLSYGVYIYSFPIQQMIIASIPNIVPRTVMALTIVIALPVAFASWSLVEKPMLSLKKWL